MGRAGWARSQPCALALAAALAVCAFYYLGGGGETFSTATRRLRATPPGPARRGRALHLLVLFTKAERSPALRDKARAALRSLLRHGRLGRGDALHLHLVTDGASRDIGEGLLRDALSRAAFPHQVITHDVNELTEKLFPIVEAMQKHFSAGTGTYYSDSIFFLSVAMHRIMPPDTGAEEARVLPEPAEEAVPSLRAQRAAGTGAMEEPGAGDHGQSRCAAGGGGGEGLRWEICREAEPWGVCQRAR